VAANRPTPADLMFEAFLDQQGHDYVFEPD
jgi:hypothetical protein